MNSKQVIISSTLECNFWSVHVQDLLTGTCLMTFKEGIICAYNSLGIMHNQYLVVVQKDSPIVHFWGLRKKNPARIRMRCLSNVSALSVTPDGNYIIVSMAEKISIYMTSSGELCTTLERHYQPITCIRISSCGSFFITGAEDGFVLLWLLYQILSQCLISLSRSIDSETNINPKHTWSHHSNKVTDIHCGYTGINGKCATVSLDSTCKIYEILSGELLASISFECPLWSLSIDAAQNFLFVGGENGTIYETRLYEKPPNFYDVHNSEISTFIGHKSKVTHLAISLDGLALISGSHDGQVLVWHIFSKQLMRTANYKGPITNLQVVPAPRGLFEDENERTVPVKSFRISDSTSTDLFEKCLVQTQNSKFDVNVEDTASFISNLNSLDKFSDGERENINSLKEEIERVKCINQQIYNFSVENILKRAIESIQ